MKGRDISFGILRCFRSSENECGRFCANGLHHAFDTGEDDAVAQDFSGQEHECGGVGVEPEPARGNGQRGADNGQPGKPIRVGTGTAIVGILIGIGGIETAIAVTGGTTNRWTSAGLLLGVRCGMTPPPTVMASHLFLA